MELLFTKFNQYCWECKRQHPNVIHLSHSILDRISTMLRDLRIDYNAIGEILAYLGVESTIN